MQRRSRGSGATATFCRGEFDFLDIGKFDSLPRVRQIIVVMHRESALWRMSERHLRRHHTGHFQYLA